MNSSTSALDKTQMIVQKFVVVVFIICNFLIILLNISTVAWRDTVVERRSLAGELSLSCARPAADG